MIILTSFLLPLFGEARRVYVRGYFRKDGTYVRPHYRTAPDGNPFNNYSFPGNYNPNTGEITPGDPLKYLERYYNRKRFPSLTRTFSFNLSFDEGLRKAMNSKDEHKLLGERKWKSGSYLSKPEIAEMTLPAFIREQQIQLHSFMFNYILNTQSDCILAIQKALRELGYQVGPLDGVIGPQTRRAIVNFQKDFKLTPNGVIGPETIAKLIEALVIKCQMAKKSTGKFLY